MSANDGGHSAIEDPGAAEHAEGVETNKTVDGAHEGGDHGQLGALLLAVHVTVFHELKLCFHQIFCVVGIEGDILDFEIDIPGVSAVSVLLLVVSDRFVITVCFGLGHIISLVWSILVFGRGSLVPGFSVVIICLGCLPGLVVHAEVPAVFCCCISSDILASLASFSFSRWFSVGFFGVGHVVFDISRRGFDLIGLTDEGTRPAGCSVEPLNASAVHVVPVVVFDGVSLDGVHLLSLLCHIVVVVDIANLVSSGFLRVVTLVVFGVTVGVSVFGGVVLVGHCFPVFLDLLQLLERLVAPDVRVLL